MLAANEGKMYTLTLPPPLINWITCPRLAVHEIEGGQVLTSSILPIPLGKYRVYIFWKYSLLCCLKMLL